MSDKITSSLRSSTTSVDENEEETSDDFDEPDEYFVPRIITTEEELEDKERIYHRDTESYFGIVLDDNRLKWICRLCLDGTKKRVIFRRKIRDKLDMKYIR